MADQEDGVTRLADESNALDAHLDARRELDNSRVGIAIPGQVHVTDANGVVHNFVGPQTVPLSYARDGGPYLDQVEDRRFQARRDFATLVAPNTVKVDDIHPSLISSPSVATEPSDNVVEINPSTNQPQVVSDDVDVNDPLAGILDPDAPKEPTDEELHGTEENLDDNSVAGNETETRNDLSAG